MRCNSLMYLLWMDLPVRKLQWLATLLEMVPGAIGASPEASRTGILSGEGPSHPPSLEPETASTPSTGHFPGDGDRPRSGRDGGWGSGSGPMKEPRVLHSPSMATQGHGDRDGPKLGLVQRAPWPSQTGLWGTGDWPSCGIAGVQPGGARGWHGVLAKSRVGGALGVGKGQAGLGTSSGQLHFLVCFKSENLPHKEKNWQLLKWISWRMH